MSTFLTGLIVLAIVLTITGTFLLDGWRFSRPRKAPLPIDTVVFNQLVAAVKAEVLHEVRDTLPVPVQDTSLGLNPTRLCDIQRRLQTIAVEVDAVLTQVDLEVQKTGGQP